MKQPLAATIERILAGDVDQYREIIDAFEADVYRAAAPILGSRNAIEDVTQETFITAYRRLESFDLSMPFRPWLLGIAANLVRNELRRQSRENARMELYSHYVQALQHDLTDSQSHRVAVGEEWNDRFLEALAKCRQRLAKHSAAAITGYYDENLSLEALAIKLQRSITATRQLLYRARLSLRDCIESQQVIQGVDQ